jgi:hypothetical protein
MNELQIMGRCRTYRPSLDYVEIQFDMRGVELYRSRIAAVVEEPTLNDRFSDLHA